MYLFVNNKNAYIEIFLIACNASLGIWPFLLELSWLGL